MPSSSRADGAVQPIHCDERSIAMSLIKMHERFRVNISKAYRPNAMAGVDGDHE